MRLLDRLDAVDRRLGLQRERPSLDPRRHRDQLLVAVAIGLAWVVFGAIDFAAGHHFGGVGFMSLGAGLLIGAAITLRRARSRR